MRLLHLQNPLMTGSDIADLQAALVKAGFLKGTKPIDGAFGPATAQACKAAKWALGYPKFAVLPTAGQQLMNFLRGSKGLPLAFRARRRVRLMTDRQRRVAAIRQSIAANARWGAEKQRDIHYAEIRPIPLRAAERSLPLTTDCSGWVTLLYKWAGASDPNGLGYNGEGYTGTLLEHGRPITQDQAQPGDLIIWGHFPGHHVAVCVEAGADPLVCSHGGEQNPVLEATSTETRSQAAWGASSYQWRNYLD